MSVPKGAITPTDQDGQRQELRARLQTGLSDSVERRMIKAAELSEVLERAKAVAADYYRLTGKPLGITGEIGEYLAAKHLGLELAELRP